MFLSLNSVNIRANNIFALAGVAFSTLAGAIVDGTDATSLEYPSAATLFRSGAFSCGGAVVGERTVLTAAQCIDGNELRPQDYTVRVGSADRSTGGSLVQVSRIVKHGSYGSSTLNYDFAILYLAQDILGTPDVTAVLLPETDAGSASDFPVKVAGWGRLGAALERSTCSAQWKSTMSAQVMCFQPDELIEPGTSACNGDTGGPIVDEFGGTVYGIVSRVSQDCTATPRANIGANVYAVKSWIKANMA
ncbi:trypsin-like protease-like protein 1 [Penicillium atrosanguineum]|uniref:Trypsin-like protease-like protein 1 n=1 Tax=Penicillium atrosanguineum TaxID=1132637 RepID=A0A9W9PSX3_9EURO|nr:trypsin-like protease-like protein 1 [Penicillium atrosanguineum]KAJ5308413.1 trypsin-like protease-like protein 1 [Penicillium atrosanguineum]